VSGALQDLDRAVMVGERTFGKGLVQQTRDLYYNSKLKVTVAKYYIPSGRCIQKLDYAHRDSTGKAEEVKEGRSPSSRHATAVRCIDGRGILPDVEVMDPELAKVVGGLYSKDLFFDFATNYRKKHAEIGPASFRISDALYQEFVDFVKDKKFDYDTETMDEVQEAGSRWRRRSATTITRKRRSKPCTPSWHRTAPKNSRASARTSRRYCATRSSGVTTTRRAAPRQPGPRTLR
jgi:carboxyl-terminal processing protease